MVAVISIVQMVETETSAANIDPYVILGIIKVESNFNPNAAKYEANFKNYYKVPEFAKIQNIDTDTEKILQQISWGLMQIMGGTARWCGYGGFIPDLADPATGIHWGVAFFKKIVTRYPYLNDQIAAYNAGSVRKDPYGNYKNQKYVDAVLAAIEEVQRDWKDALALN